MMAELSIHPTAFLRRAAALYGAREAIVWRDLRMSYADVARRTDQFAAALGAAGVEPGGRVALLGRNNVQFALGLVALATRGFTAVPLNWRLSEQALAATIERYAPQGLLFTESHRAASEALQRVTPSIRGALSLETPEAQLPDAKTAERWVSTSCPPPRRDDVFAYISTGGTEGVPKGVPVTNAMVEACVITQLIVEPQDETDVTLVLPQMFHNPHLYIFPSLLVGAKLVVPDMASFDAELVLRTIEAEGVTRFLGVATMMAYLLDAQERIGADVRSLRTISYGGAPFAPRTIERLLRMFDCDLLQLYGQTETSVLVSTLLPQDHRTALANPELRHRLRSAGRPVPLVEARVVADDGSECPRDCNSVGEILVRSPGVMAGYFEAPELTADRLRDGWCYTGDLATWDEDGYLYIVDRRNDMIISGGENVFPSAVETVIRDVKGVEDAVVIGVPDETWGEVVTAIVLPQPGCKVSEEEISRLCNERLARYMRPRTIHFVDEFPKNPSGKVQRSEVKRLFAGTRDRAEERRVGAV